MDCLGSSGAACTDRAVITAEKINEDRLMVVIVVPSRTCTVVLALYITFVYNSVQIVFGLPAVIVPYASFAHCIISS
jgi:hypothetical protein